MRTNLKIFRVRTGLSQEGIAYKIGCQRSTYAAIEKGIRSGRHEFWENLQKAFGITDSEMWELMKTEESE